MEDTGVHDITNYECRTREKKQKGPPFLPQPPKEQSTNEREGREKKDREQRSEDDRLPEEKGEGRNDY